MFFVDIRNIKKNIANILQLYFNVKTSIKNNFRMVI
jgi:hypothetical protein